MEFNRTRILNSILIISIMAALLVWYFRSPDDKLSRDEFYQQVNTNMQQQFCRVIYSRIENCITFDRQECRDIVAQSIADCINANQNTIPQHLNPTTYKEHYAIIGQCVSKDMHDTIVNSYLIDSERCQEIMQ